MWLCSVTKWVAMASAAVATLIASPAPAAQPNIIVITLDDVGDDISFMRRTTELLRQGTRYSNSFVNYPLCGPSRATFLTGQEAQNHGVTDNGTSVEPIGLVPQALQAAGYTTAMVGKHPNGFKGSPADLGFDRWAIIDRGDRYFSRVLETEHGRSSVIGYTPDRIYSRGMSFARNTPGPYFLWISAIGAHAPATPAPRYRRACDNVEFKPGPAFNEADVSDKPSWMRNLEAYDANKMLRVASAFRDHCAVLQADDEWIPRVVRLAGPDTCVFLTADNGYLFGQHRITGKQFLYEESIRVPLVMWGCGSAGGTVDARMVSNTDLPSTIIELAQASPGRSLDGYSLLGPDIRQSVNLMGQWGENETSGNGSGPSYGIRQRRWSFFEHDGGGGDELYDMDADPAQEQSLDGKPEQQNRIAAMRFRVRRPR
jgi:N-acetylglucosamine-6-sulfatase